MQTSFTTEQLADPKLADANTILRTCVHCGFCTATCPTYVLLGDELDSPRGRIYLIKEMLEQGKPADAQTVKHIDRCLSCLSCMTTCPSGVNYAHLIDQARVHVEKTYTRPLPDRLLRSLLSFTMTRPGIFRLLLAGTALVRPLASLFQAFGLKRLGAALSLAPATLPRPLPKREQPAGLKRRVGLLRGCVQSVLDPGINDATVRLLNRFGVDVFEPPVPCCGSLPLHMGKEETALLNARALIDAFCDVDIEAIVITGSGCGNTIKDYAHLLKHDTQYADKAAAVAEKSVDVTEFVARLELPPVSTPARVTYHAACTLQHGQKIKTLPQRLLRNAGFTVSEVPDGHLCCGSAGTYNMLQPEISSQLRDNKIANVMRTSPEFVATGNIGCIMQLGTASTVPIVHTVELLDWAYGGPRPARP